MDYQTDLNIEEILQAELNGQDFASDNVNLANFNDMASNNIEIPALDDSNMTSEPAVFFGDGSHIMNVSGSITVYVYGGTVTINNMKKEKKQPKQAIAIDKSNNLKFYGSCPKRLCTDKNCETLAHFGVPGQDPVKCARHRKPEHKCLIKPRCESCDSFAIYGANNIKMHCVAHREDGEILLVKKICGERDCKKRAAYYRREENNYGFYCTYHFKSGDCSL